MSAQLLIVWGGIGPRAAGEVYLFVQPAGHPHVHACEKACNLLQVVHGIAALLQYAADVQPVPLLPRLKLLGDVRSAAQPTRGRVLQG